jgi:hypothetical protein
MSFRACSDKIFIFSFLQRRGLHLSRKIRQNAFQKVGVSLRQKLLWSKQLQFFQNAFKYGALNRKCTAALKANSISFNT